MFDIYNVFIFFLLAISSSLLLAFFVYKNNKKGFSEIIFLLLSLLFSFWLVTLFLDVLYGGRIIFARLSITFAIIFCTLIFVLSKSISNSRLNKIQDLKGINYYLVLTVLVSIINMSPFAFTHEKMVNGKMEAVVGLGFIPFVLLSLYYSLASVYILIQETLKSKSVIRQQLKFVSVGILVMLFLIIVTILMPVMVYNYSGLIIFAPFYILFFLAMTAIAILKYKLFEIKILAAEGLMGVLIFVVVIWTFFSSSISDFIFRLVFTFFVAIVGFYIIRSVKKEISQRQQITELAWSLKEANLKLKEFDQKKTEFLSIASHQLRTPLSISKGQISLLRRGVYKSSVNDEEVALKDLDESNERLIDLVDNFLNITRIEQGTINYNFQKENLFEVLKMVVPKFKKAAEEKGLDLVLIDKCKKDKKILFDKEKIINVLNNLIDNAIKYSEKGVIKVIYTCGNGEVRMSVLDEGRGFSGENKHNFFKKFYRADNCLSIKGTGLGLYVVKTFIQSHDGKVWARSNGPGKGSEFGFSLPIKKDK
ncbi:MAG: hypothetical protein GF349_00445 [Candidatus Magasanikbacteria bacterium]|nr:hypothetical protein [Candidatus Magasanikbacteria bacterium]